MLRCGRNRSIKVVQSGSFFGDNDRDLEKIEYGIRFYSALQEHGSASLIH